MRIILDRLYATAMIVHTPAAVPAIDKPREWVRFPAGIWTAFDIPTFLRRFPSSSVHDGRLRILEDNPFLLRTAFAVFIENAGCTEFVAPILIEDFSFLRRGYLECEYMNRKMGRIAGGKRSPYVNMALDYQKAMMAVYNQIWLIIARNCETQYEGKNEFLEMLRNRGF